MSINNPGKILRFGNLIKNDGKTLIVTMDHGIVGITEGIKDISEIMDKVIKGGADAVLLNFGVAKKFADVISGRAGLVIGIPFDPNYVRLAVKIGADAIKTSYFGEIPRDGFGTLSEGVVDKMAKISLEAEEWGIPYINELVPTETPGPTGKIIYDVERIRRAARIGAEVGGDIVKIPYVGPVSKYIDVVRSCPVPVVVLGGPAMNSPIDVLKMMKESMEAGAIGAAIGRNVWQHENPEKMTRALARIVHENASVEDAYKEITN